MWNSFYAGGPQREKRLEAFRKLLETQGKAVEILVLQEMCLGPWCFWGWTGSANSFGYECNVYIYDLYIICIYRIYIYVYINYIYIDII